MIAPEPVSPYVHAKLTRGTRGTRGTLFVPGLVAIIVDVVLL
jgi:hypothetical protein